MSHIETTTSTRLQKHELLRLILSHRNLTVLLSAIVAMEIVRGITEIALLPIFLTDVHGEGAGLAGVTLTAYLISDVLVRTPAGWMADRFGRKRMFTGGLFLSFAPLGLMPFVDNTITLLLLNAVLGVGAGTAWPSVYATIADTYGSRNRGLIMGMLNMVMLGGLASGPVIGNLLVDFAGYVATFTVCVAFMSVVTLVVVIFMRETRSEDNAAHDREATFAGIKLLLQRDIALLTVIAIFLTLGTSTLLPILNLFGLNVLELTLTGMAMVLVVPVVVTVLAFVPLGRYADNHGRKQPMVAGMALLAVPFLLSPVSTHPAIVALGATVAGVGYAAAVPAWNALIMDKVTRSSNNHGLLFGGIAAVQGIGLAFGPALGGALWEYVGPYAPLLTAGSLFALGFGLSFFAREARQYAPH